MLSRSRRRVVLTLLLLVLLGGGGFFGIKTMRGRNPGRMYRESVKAAGDAMSAGDFSEARIILIGLVRQYPDRVSTRQRLTYCLLVLERYREAAAVARGTLELSPEYAPAHAMLSTCLRALGDGEGAIREARLATAGRSVPENAHLRLAELLIDLGLTSEGIKTLVELLEFDRTNEVAALRLATLMAGREIDSSVASGKVRRSLLQQLEKMRKTLEDSPADPEAVVTVARLAIAAGEPELARSTLIAVMVYRQLSDPETVLLARAHAATGQTDRARKLLEGLPLLTPGGIPPSELPKEERSAARAALLEFQARVVAWIETGDPKLAIEQLDLLSPQVAATLPLLKLRLIALWQMAGPTGGAGTPGALKVHGADIEATASAILQHRPFDEKARGSRSLVLLFRGRPDAALADAVFLERHSPGLTEGGWLHGLAALELGFAESALELLLKARPNPRDADSVRWIVKAAIFARNAEILARFAPQLPPEGNGALLAMVALAGSEVDRAEEITAGESFASSPLSEKVQASGLLSAIGRDATSEALLRTLADEDMESVGILKANLLLYLGREKEASAVLWEVSELSGPHALSALMALAERAAVRGDEGLAEYSMLLDKIRALPDGAEQAILHEGRMALYRRDFDGALAKAREVLIDAPTSAPGRVLELEALIEGRAEQAEVEAAANRVLEVVPGFAPARMIRALVLVKEGRRQLLSGDAVTATDRLNEAVTLAPGVAGARLLRGMALLGDGDLSTAERDVELLKGSEESRFAGHFLEGLLRSSRGDADSAVESFEAAIELDPDSVDAVTALGLALIKAGRADEAIDIAEQLSRSDLGEVRALKIRASALAANNDLEAAEKTLREALVKEKTDLGAYLLLSRVLVASKRPDEAAGVLREAIRIRPGAAAAHTRLVQVLLSAGDGKGALAAADAAGRIDGLQAQSHLLRFRCLQSSGRDRESIKELKSAVRIEPENPVALGFLGEMSLAEGDISAGRRYLEQAARNSPRNLRVLMRLGVLAQMSGHAREAEEWYGKLLAQHPDFGPAVNNLAFLLSADPATAERAVELATRAVRGDLRNGEYRDTLAVALSAAGRNDDAVLAAREAMRLLPENAMIMVRSARVLGNAGRFEEAREFAEKAKTVATPEELQAVEREVRILLRLFREE